MKKDRGRNAGRRKGFPWVGIILGFVFILIIGICAYKFGKDSSISLQRIARQRAGQEAVDVSGKLTRIPEDLGIFKKTEYDQSMPDDLVPIYYQAGVFQKGKYKGYERIVAVRDPMGPGAPVTFLLATKDRKSFILHQEDRTAEIFPDTDWRNPFAYLDKGKIAGIDRLPESHPNAIALNGDFSLFRETVVTTNVKSGRISTEGYDIYENIIRTDFSSYEPLAVNDPALSFFGLVNPVPDIPDNWEEDAKVQAQLRTKYFKGTTKVIVVDATGLPMSYTLTRPRGVSGYDKESREYEKKAVTYERERIRFEKKEIPSLPDYPMTPPLPNLRFTKEDVKGGGDVFDSYDVGVPYVCGEDVDTPTIQNISDSELVPFGSVFGRDAFVLSDPEHAVYKFAYRNKMGMSKEEFEIINKGLTKPTYEQYVARHPLLFMKDFWNRWIVLGEYDFKMIGGCGKPVLYLYPEKPTDISVAFAKPMQVTYSIPAYKGEWYVRAHPDGTLTDLVPDRTDCADIDQTKRGSEYAPDACAKNAYPYLYWTGNRIGMQYPIPPDIGWIIPQEGIFGFLQGTLDSIGFTPEERNDFLSYWVPALLEKDAPWYHIRFLQTKDMNAFVPMDIRPVPNRLYRLFMDWVPLAAPPVVPIVPQQLDPIIRKGFTAVEWGGLIR